MILIYKKSPKTPFFKRINASRWLHIIQTLKIKCYDFIFFLFKNKEYFPKLLNLSETNSVNNYKRN